MFENLPFIGVLILGLNVIISLIGFKNDAFFEKYRFHIGSIKAGQYFRLLSSGFLHVNTTHLIFNMVTFYFFVNIVVGVLGTSSFLILYLASLLAGNFFGYYFHFKDTGNIFSFSWTSTNMKSKIKPANCAPIKKHNTQ